MSKPKRIAIRLFAAFALTTLVLMLLGIVRIRYPRFYENDPFESSVLVASANGDTLTLADGRVLKFLDLSDVSARIAARSRVEVVQARPGYCDVFVAEPTSWCGTPDAGRIIIPLIADDRPAYIRKRFGTARDETPRSGDTSTTQPS